MANVMAKEEMTDLLKAQSGCDGSDHEWRSKGDITYDLKMQRKYNGSDH